MNNEIIIFENQNVKLEVNMKDETVWLTQSQMAQLFGKAVSTINEHIKNIYKEKELEVTDTIPNLAINQQIIIIWMSLFQWDIVLNLKKVFYLENGQPIS